MKFPVICKTHGLIGAIEGDENFRTSIDSSGYIYEGVDILELQEAIGSFQPRSKADSIEVDDSVVCEWCSQKVYFDSACIKRDDFMSAETQQDTITLCVKHGLYSSDDHKSLESSIEQKMLKAFSSQEPETREDQLNEFDKEMQLLKQSNRPCEIHLKNKKSIMTNTSEVLVMDESRAPLLHRLDGIEYVINWSQVDYVKFL